MSIDVFCGIALPETLKRRIHYHRYLLLYRREPFSAKMLQKHKVLRYELCVASRVKFVHDTVIDDLYGSRLDICQDFLFIRGKFTKHKRSRIHTTRQLSPDADTCSFVILAKMSIERFDAVVACVAATLAGTDSAEREC